MCLTKRMNRSDYEPLLEQIRKRIGSWTVRFLSYAGRLQLIRSVLMSIINFWMSAFRLPRSCIEEIEKLCSAFLWSGPDLNARKAKFRWKDVCCPLNEGGLGLPNLREVNRISVMKLGWRILSSKTSLWVNWVHEHMIRQGSFWSIRDTMHRGSWMWKRILKTRVYLKEFHTVEIRNGKEASFWFDRWSVLGQLFEVTGTRGTMEMGVPITATVAEVMLSHRRRAHRVNLYNEIEDVIEQARGKWKPNEPDRHLWKHDEDKYKENFSTKKTMELIRTQKPKVSWSAGVWYLHRTPKHAFIVWLACLDRLPTGERMNRWNESISSVCVLCNNGVEDRGHLFFECEFSRNIWSTLAEGLMGQEFTTDWNELVVLLSNAGNNRTKSFVTRYLFQLIVYTVWRERNQRRHGSIPRPASSLIGEIDKGIKNRLSTIRLDGKYEKGLQFWFSVYQAYVT